MKMTIDQIALLLDRPSELLLFPKGDERFVFDLPASVLKNIIAIEECNDFRDLTAPPGPTIEIPEIALPDFSEPLKLPRNVEFTTFNPLHREYANCCIKIFMEVPGEDLLAIASAIRDCLNPELFNYSLRVALEHRKDTKHIQLPQLLETFPEKFFTSKTINDAKTEAILKRPGSRRTLEIPYNYTATDVDPEHRVAYFREDVGLNLHHWQWHLIYPFAGPEEVVKKDRRGEIFYYMHHQIVARYNIERLCNKLDITTPFGVDDYDKHIPEAYFPKLDQTSAARAWPARPANLRVADVNRQVDGISIKLDNIKTFKTRLDEAIRTRRVRAKNGEEIILDDKTGIDVLGNMVEASPLLSPNYEYYGSIHNNGHIIISACHDPDRRYLEPFAVMSTSATAMRDPVFYRWHTFINSIFQNFKNGLTPYSKEQLLFDPSIDLQVLEISIISPKSNPNTLNTFWSKSDIDINYGLDFTPRGAVLARVQHLNHEAFEYRISVNNPTADTLIGTVRIFIAPRLNAQGRSLSFEEQRLLMIEMDKFTETIKSGRTLIKRKSTDSSMTVPFEATFRDQRKRPDASDFQATKKFDFCGCGWVQHMLVPKGSTNGYPMDLFVMISDYKKDKIDQPDPTGCRTGITFCGLRDRLYPDSRAMGYPFDRPANVSMQEFLTPNMKIQPITIRFSNTVKPYQIA